MFFQTTDLRRSETCELGGAGDGGGIHRILDWTTILGYPRHKNPAIHIIFRRRNGRFVEKAGMAADFRYSGSGS